ncbi:DNA topoisomerase I [Mycena sanguinolenta]|uniref:DNA topoisomerase I n=1 Tax=Mycena sanguinolenta TaxID=230812 RepID=A0A8H6Y3E3_9AGAR|nr:DNA topoisomerase I [Mycena sanguinolenta]
MPSEAAVLQWWHDAKKDQGNSVKWETLEHNGVLFPPPYEPLPAHVKMRYNGKELDLPPAAEEVAGFYAALSESEHAESALFNKNFFEDWKAVLKEHPPRCGTKVTSFELCDFRPMYDYLEEQRGARLALTPEEKTEQKRLKDEREAPYTTCLFDGTKRRVGNFRVEPPGLFRGRGEHPKKGRLLKRVCPEDITLNIGEGVPVPVPNVLGEWKAVIHDKTVAWLATWTENVNGNHKYVFLGMN